jgi:hypothetical protein
MHNSISGTEAADRLAIRYLIDALWIERNMPSNVRNCRERFLVRPHRIDGFLASSSCNRL